MVKQEEKIGINKYKLQSPRDDNDSCEQHIDENYYKIIREVLEWHDKIEPRKEFVRKQEQEDGFKEDYHG